MSDGSQEVAPLQLNASGLGRIRQWMRKVLGLDRAVGFTVLARFWSSAAGLVTVALIARFLSPAEQGYYYTFGSLVALQIVFELGFSFVILQLASHERAELSISTDYEISGAPIAHARLASVIQKSVRWYSMAAVVMACTLLPVGFYFFSTHQHAGQTVSWQLPWCFVCIDGSHSTSSWTRFCLFWKAADMFRRLRVFGSCNRLTGSLLAWTVLISPSRPLRAIDDALRNGFRVTCVADREA